MVHSRRGWPLPPPGAGAAGSPAGAEYPRQPRVQVSPLRQAAVPRAMVLPRTLMPSERRGWRGPGAFPNAGPALALWAARPGTIHSTAREDGHRRPAVSHAPGEEVETRSESRSERGNAGRCRLASQHAGRHRALRTFRSVETPSRPQGSRPGPPTVSGVMVSPEGSCGGAYQPAGYRKRCPARWSAIFESMTGRVSWVSRIENVGT